MSTMRTIDQIAIPTRNRPRVLARCLRSLKENLEGFSRTPTISVVDDSDSEVIKENRAVIESFRSVASFKIDYATRPSRLGFVDYLARKTHLPKDLLKFAILGLPCAHISTGASRNALLLASLGQRVLFIDDDVQCRFAKVKHSNEDCIWTDRPSDYYQTYFLEDLNQAERMANQPEDLIGLHEKALSSHGPIVKDIRDRVHLNREQVVDSRVDVSLPGIVGDSTYNNQISVLQCNEKTFEKLVRDPVTYRRALLDRTVLHLASQYVVSRNLPCISYCMGLDNSIVVPPFLPILRGQDHVFGIALRQVDPLTAFCAIPRAVLHVPIEPRRFGGESLFPLAGKLSSSTVVSALIARVTVPKCNRATAMQTLGQALSEIGDGDEYARANSIKAAVYPVLEDFSQRLLARIVKYSANSDDKWSSDLLKVAMKFRVAAERHTSTFVPYDFIPNRTLGSAEFSFGHLLSYYGKLLCIWPDVIAAVKDRDMRDRLFE